MPISQEQMEDRDDPIEERQRTLLQESSGATPDDLGISQGHINRYFGIVRSRQIYAPAMPKYAY
jgi:hypothetical protein